MTEEGLERIGCALFALFAMGSYTLGGLCMWLSTTLR